jgi:hypothetical protein
MALVRWFYRHYGSNLFPKTFVGDPYSRGFKYPRIRIERVFHRHRILEEIMIQEQRNLSQSVLPHSPLHG